MTRLELLLLIRASCTLAWLTAFLPSIFYVIIIWRLRKEKIVSSFSAQALAEYYTLYFPVNCKYEKREQNSSVRFQKDWGHKYGRRRFILPIIFLILVSGTGLWSVAQSVTVWLIGKSGQLALPQMAVSAFLGSYAWVVYDQLSRLRSGDFGPGDINNAVFRLLIAVPFGYGVSAFFKDDIGVATAFVIGSFPTSTLFTIARRLGNKQLGLGDNGASSSNELELLQNVGKANAERFSDEGITTIAELAWTDPIDLSIHTNFDFNYVVDCMSQSLLAVYMGNDINKLARFSLRGAQEVVALVDILNAAPDDARYTAKQKSAAEAALTGAANALGIGTDALYHTLTFVAEDPYTAFLWEIWGTSSVSTTDPQPDMPDKESIALKPQCTTASMNTKPTSDGAVKTIAKDRSKTALNSVDVSNEAVINEMYDSLKKRACSKLPFEG
jgi:hypothetical protein